jgi:hypothetical protein
VVVAATAIRVAVLLSVNGATVDDPCDVGANLAHRSAHLFVGATLGLVAVAWLTRIVRDKTADA